MKYIRTKDGRMLRVPFTKQEYDASFPNTVVSYEEWFNLWKYDIQILKQADTIEELCDYAVAVLDIVEKPIIEYIGYGGCTSKKEDFNDLFENDFNEEIKNGTGKLYGAIWTDKGLIYVAKMNDKGELKLL